MGVAEKNGYDFGATEQPSRKHGIPRSVASSASSEGKERWVTLRRLTFVVEDGVKAGIWVRGMREVFGVAKRRRICRASAFLGEKVPVTLRLQPARTPWALPKT